MTTSPAFESRLLSINIQRVTIGWDVWYDFKPSDEPYDVTAWEAIGNTVSFIFLFNSSSREPHCSQE